MPDRSRGAAVRLAQPVGRVTPLAGSVGFFARADHVHEPGAPIPISPDGVARLYVNGLTGSDSAEGTSPLAPFRSIQAAWEKLRSWLHRDEDYDAQIKVWNPPGVELLYSEYLDVRFPFAPRRRVHITGYPDNAVVVATGTLTAAGANSVTDSGANFGTTAQRGRIVRVWDAANKAGTIQTREIQMHTATVITPVEPFGVTPQVGWRYEVLRPGVRIAPPTSGNLRRGYSPTCTVNMPWGGLGLSNYPGGGPALLMSWLQFEHFGTGENSILSIDGGGAQLAAVILEGDVFEALSISRSSVTLGQVFGGMIADPLWGIGANDFVTLVGTGVAVRSTAAGGMVGMRIAAAATVTGAYVFDGVGADFPIFAQQGYGIIQGGATFSGRNIVGETALLEVYGGAAGTAIPFQVRGASGFAGLESRNGGRLFVYAVNFEGVTGAAIGASKNGGWVEINGPISKSGAGVSGFTLDVQNGGRAKVTTGATTFASTGGEVRCDAVTGTFAGLDTAAIVGAATGPASRAWKAA